MLKRRARKRKAALQALASLWPNGVPANVRLSEATRRVQDWITDRRAADGLVRLTIGYDTVLRAIVRKEAVGTYGLPSRRAPKRNAVLMAIENLWPSGVPSNLRACDIAREVRLWLADYCRREGFPPFSITAQTINSAAERKRARPAPNNCR